MSIRAKIVASLLAIASIVALLGLLSWRTNQEVETQLQLLTGSSARELINATEIFALAQDTLTSMEHYLSSETGRMAQPGSDENRRQARESAQNHINTDLERIEALLEHARSANETVIAKARAQEDLPQAIEHKLALEENLTPLEASLEELRTMISEFFDHAEKDNFLAALHLQNRIIPHFRESTMVYLRLYRNNAMSSLNEEIAVADDVLAAANRRNVGIILGAGILACAIGIFLAKQLSGPLETLKAVVDRVGAGELDVRANLDRHDEFGVLAGALDLMAENLQRADADQQRRVAMDRQRLQHLAHVNRIVTMGEMAAGVAHELNQPLGAITTYCQAGVRLLNDDEPPADELDRTLRKAAEQAHRAGTIVHRLREFMVNQAPAAESCSIPHLVSETIHLLQGDEPAGDVEFDYDYQDDLPEVMVDRIQIEQVLLNLIRNAIEAMEESGEDPKTLRIAARCDGDDSVLVEVSDSGPGSKMSDLDKIFDPFVTTKKKGMGMGLAVSRSIIEAHGAGRLAVRANPDRGLTFSFALPIRDHLQQNPDSPAEVASLPIAS